MLVCVYIYIYIYIYIARASPALPRAARPADPPGGRAAAAASSSRIRSGRRSQPPTSPLYPQTPYSGLRIGSRKNSSFNMA